MNATTLAGPASLARQGHRFQLGMAFVLLAIAIAGFTASYWMKVASGTFAGVPLHHVHGLLSSAWIGFYALQTAFIGAGRVSRHRAWGLAGIALFSVTICSAFALTIHTTNVAERAGFGDGVRGITVVSYVTLALLAALFAAAIANVRRPEVHKRLMFLVMVVFVQAAVSRILALALGAGGPPTLQSTLTTALVTDMLIVVAMLQDWRTLGRPHAALIWGGAAVLATQILAVPFAASPAGHALARALQHLAGA